MGSQSPRTMRRLVRFGLPIVGVFAAVVTSAGGAFAATPATPNHPAPPPCVVMVKGQPPAGSGQGSGTVVTKPGQPGKIPCGCQVAIKVGSGQSGSTKSGGSGTVVTKPGQPGPACGCQVSIRIGSGQGGSTASSGTGTVVTKPGQPGPACGCQVAVKVGSGSGPTTSTQAGDLRQRCVVCIVKVGAGGSGSGTPVVKTGGSGQAKGGVPACPPLPKPSGH